MSFSWCLHPRSHAQHRARNCSKTHILSHEKTKVRMPKEQGRNKREVSGIKKLNLLKYKRFQYSICLWQTNLISNYIMYTHTIIIHKSYGDGTCLIVMVKKCVKQTGVCHTIPVWSSTDCVKNPATHNVAPRFGLPCFLLPVEVLAMTWIVVDCYLRRHWLNT